MNGGLGPISKAGMYAGSLKSGILVLLVLVAALGAGCAETETRAFPGQPKLRGDAYVQTILIFGLSRPDGSVITQDEWQAFMDAYIIPRFGDGLTIIDTDGHWMMQSGELIKEDSRTILLLYDAASAQQADADIESIKTEYKELFDQEAVLRIDSEAAVSF
ncbi:MAG: DUF3574 domain-containing protein [Candidatus Dadabacteria bacterium]|nr:DUF3574 domain-containing protein [Candidatus Dadabacteria bacterium]